MGICDKYKSLCNAGTRLRAIKLISGANTLNSSGSALRGGDLMYGVQCTIYNE